MKDLLKSLSTLSEGETKDTKTGRVHKGSYGSEYDTDREGNEVKKAATDVKKGRGRPKKDGGEDSPKFDTSALGGVFGGGKKPSKQVGTVSKKHSLKEFIESIESEKSQLDEADQVEIKPAQQNTQVIQQGDKTLGTVTNPQLANQLKQALTKGEMSLATDDPQGMAEEVDTGEYDARKPVKSEPKGDWDKDFREKLKAYVRELEHRQAQKTQSMAEGKKPDFLDVDKDGDKKESFKKAVADKSKKKVDESISFNEMNAESQETAQEMLAELQDDIETFVNTGHCSDKLEAFLKVHGHAKRKIADESAVNDFAIHGVKPTNDFTRTGTSMAAPRGTPTTANRPVPEPTPFGTDPIQATTDRAINFISGLRKSSNPFSESNTMKDMQVESWSSQLDSLLNEGITVSSSQGQQGAPDSVSVTATETDADALLSVLRNAGIGGFGAEPQAPEVGYGVAQGGEEEFDGTGTEPQPAPGVVGDDNDMLSMLKKMAGIEGGDSAVVAVGGDEEGQDYEDEEGSEEQAQTLEPADGEEESGEESGEEEKTDEGNAFTGKLAQTPKGGEFSMGDKSYKDNSSLEEEGHDHDEEETCNECGGSMYEGHDCNSEQVEEAYANEPNEEIAKLKALLSMGNDMHRMKQSQAMGNPVRVAESDALAQWKKLSGL